MAQTGYTPILTYASGTPGNTPSASNLTSSASGAELAINYADGKLFYKDSGGTVQVLAVKMPSGILPIANGGTNATATPTAGAVAYGTGTAYAFTAAGTSNQVLISNGSSAPSWSNLSSLGVTSLSFGTTGLTPSTATQGAITVAGTLATTNGGTGLTSFTANGVVYASSTSVLTTGSALTFDGLGALVVSTSITNGAISVVGPSSGTNSGSQFSIVNGASTTSSIGNYSRVIGGAYNESLAFFNNGNDFVWYSGSERMRLTSKALMVGYTSDAGFSGQYNAAFYGSVGIGTSSPLGKLHVSGSGTVSAIVQSSSGDPTLSLDSAGVTGGSIRESRSTNSMIFNHYGADRMTLDSSGNLGLGVTPSAWGFGGNLELPATNNIAFQGSGNILANSYYSVGVGNYVYKTTAAAGRYQLANSEHRWYTAPSGTAGNAISFTQAMTLDASGKLLLGTTSIAGYQNVGCFVYDTPNGAGYANHPSGSVSGDIYWGFGYNGSGIGSITQNGTTAVLYNITSDQRLKENIQDADSASALIDSLQVRKYDWKSDGSHQRYGFIAQELVTVAPEAVHQPEDPEEMMAVDYSKLVPMLVKEIQSLRARVAQLEA